ncbi:MAG: cellulase family glycosylhydrolase [Bacteroidales bacterium]|nr:cellulase family glycosylhydrolase [Bacteroidales bacterium]
MQTQIFINSLFIDKNKTWNNYFAITLITCTFFSAIYSQANTAKTGMRNITSVQIVADMGAGYNLGNTFDSKCAGIEAEICWDNPYTTQAIIDKIATRGFKTLRLPVTWDLHIGAAPNYTIDKAWLDRVEVVANYAFKNDMYVILNTHHEGDWIKPTYADSAAISNKLSKLWTQIATRFKSYGDYLIFETLNEPRLEKSAEEWNGGTLEGRNCVNHYHSVALKAIRATGGNNALRHVMVSTYAASTNQLAFDAYVRTNNDSRIIVSMHSYFPWLFSLETVSTWGSATDIAEMDAQFDRIANAFIAKGYPVVMGEWGAKNNNNITDRLRHAAYYVKKCKQKGICPVYWDNGKSAEFGLLNRTTLNWDFGNYADTIINAFKYKQCTSTNHKAYIAVNDGAFQNITEVTINRGDNVKLKVEFTPANTAKWFLPNTTTTTSANELVLSNIQFANNGTYAYVPTNTTTCNSSTSMVVKLNIYQAEDFITQSGITTETTSDAGGGLNTGYTENNDWSTDTITIPKSGIYNISARVATNTTGGTIECSIGDSILGSIPVEDAKSNGWQDWYTTNPTQLLLEAGSHELKFTYKGATGYLFNLNWFDILFYQDIQNIELKKGWNLISTYLTNNHIDFKNSFPNATIIKTDNQFYYSSQSDFLNTLKTLDSGKGYILYNSQNETITVAGIQNLNQIQDLQLGWNLIGISSVTPIPVSSIDNVTIIKNFDGFYEPGNAMSTLSNLETGKAYYILKNPEN